ncbi:chalcone isomerase family protein [Pelomicrobium sp.]|uniref:chalcone isomerase family protein n=1 Tax=Pelomicrobium sp. TaxID=2815319 RepID=UPI003FA6D115
MVPVGIWVRRCSPPPLRGGRNNPQAAELGGARIPDPALLALLAADKEIKAKTVSLLDPLPGQGAWVSAGGRERGLVAGEDLYPALLRARLGDPPADLALKRVPLPSDLRPPRPPRLPRPRR